MIYIFIFNLNINSLERQDSIQELRNMVAQLSHKLGSFEDSHTRMKDINLESHIRTEDVNLERSLSPVLNRNKGRNKHLSPMSRSYKKTLRVCYIFIIKIFIFYLIFNWLCFFAIFKQDEVVQIISNLNPNLLFDVAKTFANQKKIINKKLLPAIKSAMNSRWKRMMWRSYQLSNNCINPVKKYGSYRMKGGLINIINVNI